MDKINKTTYEGKVAAAIISASIGLILLGSLTFTRNSILDILVIFKPVAALGGIWLYSYISWIICWIVLYKTIGKKQKIGNIKIWVIVFFGSLGVATILIESSLKWPPLA